MKTILIIIIICLSIYLMCNNSVYEFLDTNLNQMEKNYKNNLNKEINDEINDDKLCIKTIDYPTNIDMNRSNHIIGFGQNVPFINNQQIFKSNKSDKPDNLPLVCPANTIKKNNSCVYPNFTPISPTPPPTPPTPITGACCGSTRCKAISNYKDCTQPPNAPSECYFLEGVDKNSNSCPPISPTPPTPTPTPKPPTPTPKPPTPKPPTPPTNNCTEDNPCYYCSQEKTCNKAIGWTPTIKYKTMSDCVSQGCLEPQPTPPKPPTPKPPTPKKCSNPPPWECSAGAPNYSSCVRGIGRASCCPGYSPMAEPNPGSQEVSVKCEYHP